MLAVVFVAFWAIELPACFLTVRHYAFEIPEYVGFYYAHSLPEVFVALEFLNSSVRLEWRRFWLYVVFGVAVVGLNIAVTFTDANPYASLDWDETPNVAIPLSIVVFLIQTLSYFLLIKIRSALRVEQCVPSTE